MICIPHESIISMMKPWMNIFLFQGFHIQFLFSEIIIIVLSKSLKLPEKSSYIRVYHSMSYLFKNFVWLYSWILQKIPIYGCYLMCLAGLYWKSWKVFLDGRNYSISSISDSKERMWISSMRKIVQEYFIIFFGFLKNVFRCENISCDSVYGNQKSKLSLWSLSSKESGIKYENRRGISREIWTQTNIMMQLRYFYFLLKLHRQFSMYGFYWNSLCICKFG